jgi:hypothetical protein
MTSQLRTRFWVELLVGAFAALATVIAVASPDWIERLFGLDLDHGSGIIEWSIACGLLFISLALTALARREWVLARAR